MSLAPHEAHGAAEIDSLERAELIAEAIPHIVWTAGPDGATTYFNRRGCEYTGQPAATIHGWNWMALIHPDDADETRRAWEHAIATETEFALEYRLRRFDGAYRWHSFRALPLRDHGGAVQLWIGTATDIEDQKQLELSLRRSEREAVETLTLLKSIEAAAPIGFKLTDHDFRVLRVNDRLARINGVPIDEHIGRTVAEVSPDLWPELESVYRRALGGEEMSNVEVSRPDPEAPGGMRHWLASYYPVRVRGEIIGVGNAVIEITDRKNSEQMLARSLDAMVATIARTVEYRDRYTAGHQRRVAEIAVAIGRHLGVDPVELDAIHTAAGIHDIGKISIPAEILSKPRLTSAEFALLKQHAEAGYQIVADVEFPGPVAEMIHQHHERLDGSGYPRGLRGDDILLGARIIAVADVVEAMTAHRPYRAGLGAEAAIRQIQRERGQLLDAAAVDACVELHQAGRLLLLLASGSNRPR